MCDYAAVAAWHACGTGNVQWHKQKKKKGKSNKNSGTERNLSLKSYIRLTHLHNCCLKVLVTVVYKLIVLNLLIYAYAYTAKLFILL